MKQIQLGKTRRPFEAYRDENGVAQIKAANWLDAVSGLGYMHAVDRGTQMLFARSVASGRAAEQISDSPELLETDRFFRRTGLFRDLDREIGLFDDRLFNQVTAYCDGVNDGLETLGRSWPMWATSYQKQPWNQKSVILIGKLLSFGGLAISQMQNERLVIELIHAGADQRAMRELFGSRLDHVDFDVIRRVRMANQLSDEALELITDLPRLAGSNAWVVGPQRSATGGAMLASDPHLEINRLPAIWYEAALAWGESGRYVMGATLPGCPLFAVARTDRVSWGVTYMKGDTVDYFIEDCRRETPPAIAGESDNGGKPDSAEYNSNGDEGTGHKQNDNPHKGDESPADGAWQYRRGDEWRDFQRREERLRRKGSDEEETLVIHENEQGFLDGDLAELGEGYHLSVAWTGQIAGNGQAIATWLKVVQANDAREGMDIVRECPQPTLCWVFADREGHIGMQACGRFPNRGGQQIGLAPIPAWDEANHWQGCLPSVALPREYDPPRGFISTANEEVNPPGQPMLVTQPLPDYRKRRIDEFLAAAPKATISDMQQLQYDFISLQARDLMAIFSPHLPPGELKTRLDEWDHSYEMHSQEATLFLHLYRNVMLQILGHRRGLGFRRMLYLCSRAGFSVMLLCAADRLLARDDSQWWSGRDKGELIRQAAEQIDVAAARPWSEVNNFHFTDRFFGNHQVGRMLGYNSRRYPMPGNHATPFQGHVLQTATRESTFAPSYHFVTDMGTDEAWTNLPGGPSENRFSKLYRNDVKRWLTGEYKRLVIGSAEDEE